MAADLPTTLSCRFGIRTYQLSDQDLLHPGDLVDRVIQVKDVARAGSFVGRLKHGPTTGNIRDNVDRVKRFLRSNKECHKSIELRQRMQLPGQNMAFLIHSTGEGKNAKEEKYLQKLRKHFVQKVLAHNFEEAPKTGLECVLDSGVGNFLNTLLGRLTDSEPIMYGQNMDLQPTLHTTASVELSSMSSNIKQLPGGRHVGIVSPTVYIGTEASTFNCHREDAAFEGVNRHIAGSPKLWFTVAPRFHNAFCLLINKLGLPADERLCSGNVQHKFLWIDPRIVVKNGIPVRLIIQRPGDIVFVLANTIHWGVNVGFNLNEAVNIASNTWARPGMMCPPRCQCDCVVGLYFKFDISPMLRSIGVAEDTILRYEEGDIMEVSQELRFIHPDLHPEMGVPDCTAVNLEHLLGPETDWDQVGKVLKPLVREGHEGFVGGFELVDLTAEEDAEKERQEVDVAYPQFDDAAGPSDAKDHLASGTYLTAEEGAEMERREVDEAYPQFDDAAGPSDAKDHLASGTYKCPSCGKDTNRYGERGMTALRSHIASKHIDQREKLLQEVYNMYSRSRRQFLSPSLICDLCGKTVRGTTTHLIRHQESRNCMAPTTRGKRFKAV